MKTQEQLEQQLERLEQQMTRIERILLTTVSFRRLPLDLQRHAAELQGEAAPVHQNDRERVVMAEFEKMCAMDRFKRKSARWPEALIQSTENYFKHGENTLPVIPLSGLTNRCAARSVFKVGPGEISPRANAENIIAKLGLVVTSISDAGLEWNNHTKVVHRASWNPAVDEIEDPIEEPITINPVVEKVEEPITINPVIEEIEDDLDDDEIEDDDLGDDEIEFVNPDRERFEREAAEAAERERDKLEKLASGKYYLRNGIVTLKK